MLRHTSLCVEQSQVIDNIGKQATAEHLRCVRAFGLPGNTSPLLPCSGCSFSSCHINHFQWGEGAVGHTGLHCHGIS